LGESPWRFESSRPHNSLTRGPHTFRVTVGRTAGHALVLLLALVLAAGCGYGDDDEEPEARPQAHAVPGVPEPEDGTGSLPVDEFNDFVDEARPAFGSSALRTAIEFAHAGEGQAATTSVVVFEGPEGTADEATVTVTRDGLADDSTRALRYLIVLERADDESWRLRSARRTQRCQTGRGSQAFSTKLCR
jgi:hypothetical protein